MFVAPSLLISGGVPVIRVVRRNGNYSKLPNLRFAAILYIPVFHLTVLRNKEMLPANEHLVSINLTFEQC